MATYQIKSWDRLFETYETLKLKRLTWVPIPNKHDGKGYRRILRLKDGPMIYAAWLLIVQVASKCEKRGVLADCDGSLSAEDLSDKTGFPVKYFEMAFKHLVQADIGWMECDESAGSTASHAVITASHAETTALKGIEGKGIEGKGIEDACGEVGDADSPPKSILAFPCAGIPKTWDLTETKLSEWTTTFPHLDVKSECRKALQWLKDNPSRQKTAAGMTRFLGSWLGREQNRGGGAVIKTARKVAGSPEEFEAERLRIAQEENGGIAI